MTLAQVRRAAIFGAIAIFLALALTTLSVSASGEQEEDNAEQTTIIERLRALQERLAHLDCPSAKNPNLNDLGRLRLLTWCEWKIENPGKSYWDFSRSDDFPMPSRAPRPNQRFYSPPSNTGYSHVSAPTAPTQDDNGDDDGGDNDGNDDDEIPEVVTKFMQFLKDREEGKENNDFTPSNQYLVCAKSATFTDANGVTTTYQLNSCSTTTEN